MAYVKHGIITKQSRSSNEIYIETMNMNTKNENFALYVTRSVDSKYKAYAYPLDNSAKRTACYFTYETIRKKDDGTTELKEFSFTGVTLLGETVRPAVSGANAKLIQNSSSSTNAEYEKAKVEFEKILYNSVKQESVETDSFFNTKNKEETMETEVIKNSASPEVIENATQEVSTKVEVSTDTYSYDDDGKFVGATHEEHEVRTVEVKEVPEEDVVTPDDPVIENAECVENADCKTDTVENAECVDNAGCKKENAECKSDNSECKTDNAKCENECKVNNSVVSMEEFEALKVKCSTLETELETKKADYDALMLKCSALETYKNNKENENMKNTIEVALNSVSHILSTDQIDEWRKESEKCSAETVDEFTNKLKAFAFDIQEKNGVIQTDSIRNSIPREVDVEPTDFWERMEKKYN